MAELVARFLSERYRILAVSPFEEILSEHRVVLLDGDALLTYEKVRDSHDSTEWRHNLRFGAEPRLETSRRLCSELADLGMAAIRAVGGAFMSVDIVATSEGMRVMEINSGVSLNHFAAVSAEHRALAVNVYRAAVQRCFSGDDA